MGRFGTVVRLEAAIGALILLIAAVMTSIAPAREIVATRYAQTFTREAAAGDLRARLRLAPARLGANVYEVQLRDSRGRPVDDASRVQLVFTFLGADLGPAAVDARSTGDGRYVARGNELALVGPWQTSLLVRRPGYDDVRAAWRLVMTSAGAELPAEERSGGMPELTPRFAIGLELVLIGVIVLLGSRQSQRLASRAAARNLAAVLSAALILVGVYVVASEVSGQRATTTLVANPYPPTGESLARGQSVYLRECAACHGDRGRGDGPLAETLSPRPVDLKEHVPAHSDAQLFAWVSGGIRGSAMPGFRDRLSEEDRWHILNYLRTLAPTGR